MIEVADSSLDFDCGEKADLYAAAGIKDYWVVDVQNRQVHVYRKPGKQGYAPRSTHPEGDRLAPLSFPEVTIDLGELFAK